MKMVLIAASMALAQTARALFSRGPSAPCGPGAAHRAPSRPVIRQFANHPPRPAAGEGRGVEAPKGAAEVTLDAQQATDGGGAAGGASPQQQAAPLQHHRALEQLEAVERALHAHLLVPGTPFRLGVDTALGRVPFAGVFAYAAVGAYTLAMAWRYQAAPLLLTRMAANVMLDNGLHAVPLVGPWVAPLVTGGNARNLQLLRRHIQVQQGAGGAAEAVSAASGAGVVAGAEKAAARLRQAWGWWGAARGALMVVTWPVRRLPLWGLLAAVVAAPLGAGLGLAAFAVWSALHWVGLA